jgi:hypothetical protein
MEGNNPNIIQSYLNSTARNKIIFFRNDIPGIEPINLGNKIAGSISKVVNDKRLSLKAKLIIEDVLSSSHIKHDNYGKILAISNIGILFEPDLKIDILNLFDSYSSGTPLFIKWEGETEKGKLFFLSKQNGIKVELKNISHIII